MGEQRIVMVTGASRGIGRAILANLVESGHTLLGTATSPEGAEKISHFLEASGVEGRGLVLQQQEASSIDALFAELKSAKQMPTVLINNAGITRDNILLRMKPEEWDEVIKTDLSALYRLCKGVLKPMMRARFGRIVNVSSVVGSIGNVGQCNYAAAKGGMEAFSKSLAREMAGFGITVNCVAPGFIQTEMTDVLDEEQAAYFKQMIPLARMGTPEEVASAVSFLMGASASYITGQTLHVNGGMLMS